MRKWGVAVAVLGVLFLGAAAILRFVVVPAQAQLASDEVTTDVYEGTAAVALNAEALAKGDLANAFLQNVPITISRTVRVVDTDGGSAIVTDRQVVKVKGTGSTIATSEDVYAIDRKDMTPVAAFGSRAVEKQEGLTVTFPIGTEKKDYVGWQADTQQAVPLKYAGEDTRSGLSVYVFTGAVPASPITNPRALASLPQALPKALLPGIAQASGLSDTATAQLNAALPSLPAEIPLSYTYEGQSKYWVDPTTGRIIDLEQTDARKVVAPALSSVWAGTPVLAMTFAQTDASVAQQADVAKSDNDDLQLFGTTLPIVFLVLGLGLVVGGVYLSRRRTTPPAATWTEDQLPGRTPAGR